MGERNQPLDELPFVPYGWSEATLFNEGIDPLSATELRAFYALRELGEPTLIQLDEAMNAQGLNQATVRDLKIDEFFQIPEYGRGYNNFLSHFTWRPVTSESMYALRPVMQRYQAAYGDHFELLRQIGTAKRDEKRRLAEVERFEFFWAYQRMRHLVAESDPGYGTLGAEYLAA